MLTSSFFGWGTRRGGGNNNNSNSIHPSEGTEPSARLVTAQGERQNGNGQVDLENGTNAPPPAASIPSSAPVSSSTTTTATNTTPVQSVAQPDFIAKACKHIKQQSVLLFFLMLVQQVSSTRMEPIDLLDLFSFLVVYFGYEGAESKSRSQLIFFYYLCTIYIPLNVFHLFTLQARADMILKSPMVGDHVKKQIRFDRIIFGIVTVIIILSLSFAVYWVRQLLFTHHIFHLNGPPVGRLHEDDEERAGDAAAEATAAPPTGGLAREEFDRLPKNKIQTNREMAEDDVCAICQTNFEVDDTVRTLPECRHQFHLACIDQWFERSSICPICNRNVRDSWV